MFAQCLVTSLPECKLIFLPPYSPDLNPIEQAFSSIKAFLRRHWQDFSLSIIDHACQNITAEKAWGFFRASGYVV
jgi:transposase